MIVAVHHQRSFRAEQTDFFFLLRSCEVAGLRSRGISLRFIQSRTAAPLLRSYRQPLPPRPSQQVQTIDPKLRFPTSTLKPPYFQYLPHSLPLCAQTPLSFQHFPNSFVKNHPGWGTPRLKLRTKNETCTRKTSSRPPSLPLPLCHQSKMPQLSS